MSDTTIEQIPSSEPTVAVPASEEQLVAMLVDRARSEGLQLTGEGGLLVEVLPSAGFVTATAVLAPGDTFLLYTDGLTEARTGDDRTMLFGEEAFRAFAALHAGRPAPDVIEALTGLLDSFGDGLDDDTALLALGVPAPERTTSSE